MTTEKKDVKLLLRPPDTHKILVGWRTRPVDNVETLLPTFKPPSNYKNEDKIKEYLAEKKAEFLAMAKDQPYTGTFAEVYLLDTGPSKNTGHWLDTDRPYTGKGPKPPVCVTVRNWILKRYPNAWPDDTNPGSRKPEVVFLGFEPRNFLKMLGLECSLPWINKPLPAAMWYGNTDHRDIAEACIPKDYAKTLDWATVFKVRGIIPKEGWTGPGQDPTEDVRLILELGTQLGFLKYGETKTE